jgi:hypothetical protein
LFCGLPVPGPAADPVFEAPPVPPDVENELDLGRPVVPVPLFPGDDSEPPVVDLAVEPTGVEGDVVCPCCAGPPGWGAGDGVVSAKARPATSAATAAITRVGRNLRGQAARAFRCG